MVKFFFLKNDESLSKLESCTIELVFFASAHLFPDNALHSFTDVLPEQLNLECQWEVAISEIFYMSMHQGVTEGTFLFPVKKKRCS